MSDERKMLQVSSEAHEALKAYSKSKGDSMYSIASEALQEACGDDLGKVGGLLRQLEADESPGACMDVLAYILAEHGAGDA